MRDWAKDVSRSRPRRCARWASATVKLEANMEAVILWQSEQLQTKLLMRPGAWVGWWDGGGVSVEGLGGRGKGGKSGGWRGVNEGAGLTNASCTAPQKHVAVASFSLDQPSSAPPARGM